MEAVGLEVGTIHGQVHQVLAIGSEHGLGIPGLVVLGEALEDEFSVSVATNGKDALIAAMSSLTIILQVKLISTERASTA